MVLIRQLSKNATGKTYLITKCMTANDNGFSPARNDTRDIVQNNRLTENCTVQNVTDGTIG